MQLIGTLWERNGGASMTIRRSADSHHNTNQTCTGTAVFHLRSLDPRITPPPLSPAQHHSHPPPQPSVPPIFFFPSNILPYSFTPARNFRLSLRFVRLSLRFVRLSLRFVRLAPRFVRMAPRIARRAPRRHPCLQNPPPYLLPRLLRGLHTHRQFLQKTQGKRR